MLIHLSVVQRISKKELLSQVLYYSGLLRATAGLGGNGITILTYHRIREDGERGLYAFDEDVFGPTQSCFERQMKWLKKNTTVLGEGELLDAVERPVAKDRYTVVTFDDGYRDNYDLAYPVLRAYSIPAIFFVCPGLLEERRVGWWDLIAYLVKQSAKLQIELRGETLRLGEEKAGAIRKLHDWMKSQPAADTADLVDRLSESSAVSLPPADKQAAELMTWEQVAEVSDNGVAIGSHTHTHRVLATLNEDGQRWELRESKLALERRLGGEVKTIAYPAGRHGNFTQASMRIARECGYRGAFSFHSGGNRVQSLDRFDLHRVSAADSFNPMFLCEVMAPEIFT
jgi:peptidoglycan/xylan/chitin deacetylase (PgdA/CDA1 family)